MSTNRKKTTGKGKSKAKSRAKKTRKIKRSRRTEEQIRLDAVNESIQQHIELNQAYDRSEAGQHILTTTELMNSKGSGDHKKIIGQANIIYKTVGVIRNSVDLMSDFAAQGIKLVHEEPDQQAFYNAWARKIGLFNRSSHFLRSLFKAGNTIVFRQMAKLRQQDVDDLQSVGGIFDGLDPSKEKHIPVKYTFIDPTVVEKIGTTLFGQLYEIEVSRDDRLIFKKPVTKKQKQFISRLPREVVNTVIKRGVIVADDKMVFVGHYQKDDWEDWAEPIFFPVFDDIAFKKLLRRMDESVARNIMNSIVVFRLGNAKDGFPATKIEIQKFSSLLKTPTKSKTIVWNNLVDFIATYPPVNLMLNDDKYKAVNNDILSGLGISEVLINGAGGNYANSFLSVKTLLEKLESGREVVIEWLNVELELIRTAMGWEKLPEIRFGRMTLRDERAEKALILNLLDKGIISNQTALSYFGENWSVEIKRIRQEEEFMNRSENKPSRTRRNRGRPVNTKDRPQRTKRDTKPQGLSSELEAVIEHVTIMVMSNKGVADEEDLSVEDRYNIRIFSESIAPHLKDPLNTNADEVAEIISEMIT